VTSVEEWTNAEIGVGAAIAAGSQEEKGIWALFVIAAIVSITTSNGVRVHVFDSTTEGVKVKDTIRSGRALMISTSPIRLVSTVIYPAERDEGVW
jgi:hypothetical protein